MGWANCGKDDLGRPIGYAHKATCDHPGCKAQIDRGLAYACGGRHGDDEHSCARYFCGDHLVVKAIEGQAICMCHTCAVRDELDAMTGDT